MWDQHCRWFNLKYITVYVCRRRYYILLWGWWGSNRLSNGGVGQMCAVVRGHNDLHVHGFRRHSTRDSVDTWPEYSSWVRAGEVGRPLTFSHTRTWIYDGIRLKNIYNTSAPPSSKWQRSLYYSVYDNDDNNNGWPTTLYAYIFDSKRWKICQ